MVGPALTLVNAHLGRRAFGWGAVLAVFGIALGFLPLFDVLGYDYAFALGLPAGFAAVDLGHAAAVSEKNRAARLGVAPALSTAFGWGLTGALGLLLLPLLASLLNALRVRNCSVASGLGFYALLPVGTALYAAPLGTLVGLSAGGTGRRGRVIALLLPVASLLWTLLRLYRDPPVFAFDPFGGYFPGPIYDEAMRPPLRLVQYRAANLLWVATAVALWVARRAIVRGRRGLAGLGATVVLVCASITVYAKRGDLGFHVTRARLLEALSRQTVSPHFRLHTDARAGDSAADLELVRRDLEFRYSQLAKTLGIEPAGPVDVFQFPSAAAKKDWVGAGGTLYAKPWTREIFVQTDRFPAARLRHELAHVFAGAFGDPLFGVSLAWRLPLPALASGLIEGVAEAADFTDPEGRSTTHQEARAMIADGNAPPLRQVLGAGFTTLSGARAYTVAGSFCRFVLETRGADKLRALYRSAGDFEGVYGQPLETLERTWRAFLETQPVEPSERSRARERFRRPAIFQKVCARELAARVAEARGRLYAAPAESVTLLQSVCIDDPAEPTFQLELAEALTAARQPDKALSLAVKIEADEGMTHPLRARAALVQASIHFWGGRFDAAEAAMQKALGFATDDGEQRTATAKLRALHDPQARRTLGRVLYGDGPAQNLDAGLALYLVTEFARLFPDEALGPYLVARQLSYRDPALALARLDQACPTAAGAAPAVPLAPIFAKECTRLTGEVAFRAGDVPRARAAYTRLATNAVSEAERLRAADFLARIDWETTQPPRTSGSAQ